MSPKTTNGLNPVDGLPEWRGRRVVTELEKRRAAKRARRFVLVDWGVLAPAMQTMGTDRATRLYLVLHLHAKLRRTTDGWVKLPPKDLAEVGLADGNFNRAVTKLERLGLVETRRSTGRRPLLRLSPERPAKVT
jgi:hypothetical protein